MLKSLPGKSSFNFAIGSKNSFEDYALSNRFLPSQAYEKLKSGHSSKLSLLQINMQKVKNKNSQLMKLFKQSKAEYINTELLEKSDFMKTNELFFYLVNCLKKERQGLISVNTISEERAKSPKPIETKIRQFLYHSLQQSLLMSQKQVEESKYFERLFKWFTEVFKETEMKLSFKMASDLKKDSQQHDQDWIIRSTFKSSMPEEVGEYQRKMLNIHQLDEVNKKFDRKGQKNGKDEQNDKENIFSQNGVLENLYSINGVQKKLFTRKLRNSFRRSSQLLPVLDRKGFHSTLSKLKQEKELQELRVFQLGQKRSKAHFEEHLAKKYSSISKIKQQIKYGERFLSNSKHNKKSKQSNSSFNLESKVMDKIQAAKLGVTFTEFRKNKENILQEKKNVCYDSPVYHPYLTSNYFHDIKKKKLDTLRSKSPTQFKYNSKNTEESDDMNSCQLENTAKLNENFDDMFNPPIPTQNVDEVVSNIDGLGLANNPLDKVLGKVKKNQVKK